jgi:hypothetical protein
LNVLLLPIGLAYGKANSRMHCLEQLRDSAVSDGNFHSLSAFISGVAAIGIYYPTEVLSILQGVVNTAHEPIVQNALIDALGLIRAVHPEEADAFVNQFSQAKLLQSQVVAGSEVSRVRNYVRVVGAFNNSVHLSVYYPIMRRVFAVGAFDLLSRSPTREAFLTDYTRAALKLFRAADFDLTRWTAETDDLKNE